MGMFDTIKCSYVLPYTLQHISELSLFDETIVAQDEFQTKDLECMMVDYTITTDGLLKIWEFSKKHNKPIYKNIKHTGSIEMYNWLSNNHLDHDLYYRWKLKFKCGKLKKCKLLNFDREDNSKRKRADAAYQERFEKWKIKKQTIRWKIYDTLWRTPVINIIRKLERMFVWHKIENILKFWG